MKKIISFVIGLMLLSVVLAQPPTPMPFVIYVSFEGTAIVGLDVTFTCNGAESITRTTNDQGGVMIGAGGAGDFGKVCAIISTSCGYEACNQQYNPASMNFPYTASYELGEAPEPPECTTDLDCNTGYECKNYECVEIIEPEPTPTPEPTPIEDKVSSNEDGTIALIEANFGDCVDVVITDSKLSKLFDGTIDFDTEDYDVHEEIALKYCIRTSLDNTDFGLEPYVLIQEEAIEYRYVFDDVIPVVDIERDEELEINFLGTDIEIIHLSGDKLTIRHGEVFLDLKEGGEIIYNNLPLKVEVIDSDFVYVTYNGDSEKIFEDDIGEVGGIQVYVDEAVPNEDGDDLCSLRIATDIEEAIEDGDEFTSDWEYVVTESYIGIRNSEEYKYLDEGNKPLTLGDKISLPNDFAIIKVNKISTSEVTEIDIKIRDELLFIQGEREDDQDDAFSYNSEEYDEVYVGDEGILDSDKVIISNKVRIGESDVYLEKGSLIIGDLTIELNFLDILFKGVSIASRDENYLTYDGIIFKNPEDSVNNKDTFNVIVPDEVPEVTVTIGLESETVGLPEEPCTPEECEDTICEECTTCEICEECPSVEVCELCEECPDCEFPLVTVIVTLVMTLIISIGGGLKFYKNRLGNAVFQHRHKGITAYHNPSTSHRNPVYKHRRWKDNPLGCMADVTKINNGISMG
jgi:hypothetical protein